MMLREVMLAFPTIICSSHLALSSLAGFFHHTRSLPTDRLRWVRLDPLPPFVCSSGLWTDFGVQKVSLFSERERRPSCRRRRRCNSFSLSLSPSLTS